MFLQEKDEDNSLADSLGGRIVAAREALEFSTAQLARRLGVKTETLHSWETDRAAPRANRLLNLAGILNVSPTWLLTGSGESPSDTLDETEMAHIRARVSRLQQQLEAAVDELGQLNKRLGSYQSYQE